MKLKLIGVALMIAIVSARAQTDPPAKKPEFEVASVKRARSGESYGYRFGPGGRAILTHVRLRDLILVAGSDWSMRRNSSSVGLPSAFASMS
jgi:hypothetical protein